jgi:hypothetical protein
VQKATGRRFRPAALVAAAIALVAAGSLAIVMSLHGSKPTTAAHGRAVAPTTLAAAWVAHQVSQTAIVGCDPVMCRALQAHGLDHLLVLGSKGIDPLRSQVIIATATVRNDLGAHLGSVYAPGVIASFGSGNERVDIRMVARDGPVAYRTALATDLATRRREGSTLLVSGSRVVASASARQQMLAGQVDSQLLATILSLATLHPVDVLAFGDSAPGASAGMPLRSADLAETVGATALRDWLASLHGQKYPWAPALTETIRLHGKPVLLIEFAAPTPLGLLAS